MNKVVSILVNLCRIVLASVFIFSGYVKAIDPHGTEYKIQDYLAAWGMEGLFPDFVCLTLSIVLSTFEFTVGIMLLFAIQRRATSKVAWAFLFVMTPLTLWIWIANPVSDCGCFGDAIVLTNAQTFWKNIILLGLCTFVTIWPLKMVRFISQTNQWIVSNFAVLFVLASSIYSLYYLPIFDFRPYHVGANIKKGMEIPEDAKQPRFDTTFLMEKDGVRKEFTLDNYPDSTWQFVDSKTTMVEQGYVPPIHDFTIDLEGKEDITEQVLHRKGYTFLLVSPHLERADDSNFGKIDLIYEYAQEEGIPFYCLTASGEQAQRRWQDMTGAEYPFCLMDEITLKTIIRSNPGLVLLKDATVIRKWSHNDLPAMEEMEGKLSSLSIGQMPTDSVPTKLLAILMWFVLPLTILTLADRTWAWSKWFRRRRSKKAPEDKNI